MMARPKKTLKDLPKNIKGQFLLYCAGCGKEKFLGQFNKDNRSGIGYQTICKKCEKSYRDSHKASRQDYLSATKEERGKQMRQYFLKNRESINLWRRSYYANEGHLIILLSNEDRRSAKISSSDGTVTSILIEELFIEQQGKCNGCDNLLKDGKNGFHIDHIKPLIVGGIHTKTNIQLLCPTCNLQKGRKTMEEYMTGRPTKYDPEYFIPLLEKLLKEGATIEEFCAEVKINKDTFYKWIKKYPEFSDSKKRAEDFALAWWLKEGRINLRNKDFSAVLFYMNMKNRFGWKDKSDITSDDKPIKIGWQK